MFIKIVTAALALVMVAACEASPKNALPSGQDTTLPPPDFVPPTSQSKAGAQCGTIAGLVCGQDSHYCAMDAGICRRVADAAGVCTSKPEVCPMIYAPVCGCDGQTYSNNCTAAASGVNIVHEGACPKAPQKE